MITTAMTVASDTDLVSGSLSGDRDAFGQIVSRYQSLICSLAYSAIGNLGQSEDLAQETFITAWKHLGKLRERDKLRAWLCGIARNRINNFLRREGREPVRKADSLEEVSENHAPEPLPIEHAISKEESEILWRALERIPEIYREPLILFYREHQSIETVAANLDLTEDNVKQRLSRGRKLLQEQVLAFVEGALARTNPGKTFTLNVLAALPAVTTSAKMATLGAAAKGATAKAAGVGVLGAILNPLMIIFGNYLGYRIGLAEARSDEERNYVKSFYKKIWALTLGFSVVLWTVMLLMAWNKISGGILFTALVAGTVVVYLAVLFVMTIASSPQRRRYYAKILEEEHGGIFPEPAFEYCSRIKFLGLPLVHIRMGDRFDLLRKPVTGWIVCANYAVGGLFAFGGVAIAPLSIGAVAVGVLPLGAIAAGIFAVGALAMGVWTLGAISIGWFASGCVAVAWKAAVGLFAAAHDFALGRFVYAAQCNNETAKQFVTATSFYRNAEIIGKHWFWMNLLWIAPLFIQWQVIVRKNKVNRA